MSKKHEMVQIPVYLKDVCVTHYERLRRIQALQATLQNEYDLQGSMDEVLAGWLAEEINQASSEASMISVDLLSDDIPF